MIRLCLISCLALVLSGCVDSPNRPLPKDGLRPMGWIDVRLVTTRSTVDVAATGAWSVYDNAGNETIDDGQVSKKGRLSLRGDGLRLAGKPLGTLPLELRPRGKGQVIVEGVRYHGLLRLERDADGALLVINRVAVDDYLKGVLPGEMPDRFGQEALRAQAVAARSYALAEVAERGWVHPDARSQVYGGVDAETFLASRAVSQTSGEVLTFESRVITAWFHSTCGGSTQPARNMFRFAPSGVMDRFVPCKDCKDSSAYSWRRSIPGAEVCAAAGLPDGAKLLGVEPLEADFNGFPGRPARLLVRSDRGQAEIGANDLRSRVSRGKPTADQLLSTRWNQPARVVSGRLVVNGNGWGHGVGLCQWGAGGHASRGASYRAILRRYYPGAELVKLS